MNAQTDQEYEEARVKAMEAEGAPFVPEGTGKKRYIVTCKDGSDWNHIHKVLMEDGTLEDNIPSDKCDCVNEYKTCDRIGTYLLDDAEVEDLKNHSMVDGVNLDCEYYEGTFKGANERPMVLSYRYPANVKCGRLMGAAFFPTSAPNSTYLSRTGSSVYRHTQKTDPWNGQSEFNVLQNRIEHHGDGSDVDVVVCDESGWYGHAEFVKTGSGEPTGFVGGNILKNGFATSSTTGVCGVLDFVLDTPYYIDPDFFENDPTNRLTTRWDGTKVPVESWARSWWGTESTAYRSAKYVSNNVSGGTATVGSAEDFGTISISSSYTRAAKNGSNTTQHTSGGYHATPCMSQAYGKTMGWAYNSNKWHMNIIWSTGAIGISNMFKMLKIFHQLKPNRSSDNTKNPTLTSHSWGSNRNLYNQYYYYRSAGDGTGGVSYTSGTKPTFLNNLYYSTRHSAYKDPSYSEMVLGADMISAGVIFFAASGNDNQKTVNYGHPDYNNYDATTNSTTLANALYPNAYGATAMTNRTGFPSCIGRFWNGYTYIQPAFNIGALDDQKVSYTQERKASYSNTGNAIDMWTHGKGSFAAGDDNYSSHKLRYEEYYRLDSNYNIVSSGGTLSDDSEDISFGGTSSACPVACGLVATIVQHNRTWTYEDITNWLETSVDNQSSSAYYTGTEGTSANDSNYNDDYNLHGNNGKILYQALPAYTITPSASTVNEGDTITTTVTTENILDGLTLYWNITGTNINSSDFSSGSLTGSGTISSNALPSFSHTLANDLTTEGNEFFNINLFTDSARTKQVATTAITINDTSVPVVQTYTISPSPLTVNEGNTVTTTVTTTNVSDNTTLWWSLSGMNQVDFSSGALTGFGIITSNTFSFTHTLAVDEITEGTEYINYELFTDSGRTARVGIATVTVLDTSQAEPVLVPVTLSGSGVTLSGVTVNIK